MTDSSHYLCILRRVGEALTLVGLWKFPFFLVSQTKRVLGSSGLHKEKGNLGVGGGCDDSAHPSGIYNRGELPVKKLALKDNYEDIQDKELTPYINTN